MARRTQVQAATITAMLASFNAVQATKEYTTKSGILPWVDPATPSTRQTYTTSRGATWDLVMSDEFNKEGRSFEPGDDHLWTSMDKADGVNSALEIYMHNMTGTECDDDNCYFYIEADAGETTLTLWNDYLSPAGYEDVTFYYKAGMVQSWNKFCFQGGMIEVRAQLPGAVTNASGNPDVETGSGSRISACDDDPGHGLNANQGRGAPEIDILEGGGTAISSSIQVGPGMPDDFRMLEDNTTASSYCFYSYGCTTEGANNQDVPTAYYWNLRGHKSWYQGLRYGANNICDVEEVDIQSFATINASLAKGITDNACTTELCPASYDVNGDMGYKDNGTVHWGINANGTCFPSRTLTWVRTFAALETPTPSVQPQADPLVPARNSRTKWMQFQQIGNVTNPPQDTAQMNPKKMMIEEPMYIIFNVALSSSWGSSLPTPAQEAARRWFKLNDKHLRLVPDVSQDRLHPSSLSLLDGIILTTMATPNRFVAGPSFYNYDMYGGLRPGGLVRFFSSEFVGLVAATFTSAFVYIGARYGLLLMVSSKLQLSEDQTEAMDRLVEVPAAMAFFVGLYADAVPLWGSRRKSYMVLGMAFSLLCLALIGLGCLFAEDLDSAMGSSFRYIMMLLMGVADDDHHSSSFDGVLVIPALYRSPVVYHVLTGIAGVSSGVMALVLLVPVTEIIEEGSEGGVVGLALSFNTIFKVFASTLLTTIQRASYFPSSDQEDTTHRRWSIAILELVTYCVNSLAFAVIPILPLQKLDAQLVRMYGGFTDNASALTAAAFLTSLAYCVAYNIYIFSVAITEPVHVEHAEAHETSKPEAEPALSRAVHPSTKFETPWTWSGCVIGCSYLLLLVTCAFLNATFVLWPLTLLRWTRVHSIRSCRSIFRFLEDKYFTMLSGYLELVGGVKIVVTGDEELQFKPQEHVLLICNHRSEVDWIFFWNLALRLEVHDRIRVMLKSIIRYAPGVGWTMMLLQYPYINRNWATDQDRLAKVIQSYKDVDMGTWLAMFPEGTALYDKTLKKSHEFAEKQGEARWNYVLQPRVKGFELCMDKMDPDYVVDLTVAYPQLMEGVRPSPVRCCGLRSVILLSLKTVDGAPSLEMIDLRMASSATVDTIDESLTLSRSRKEQQLPHFSTLSSHELDELDADCSSCVSSQDHHQAKTPTGPVSPPPRPRERGFAVGDAMFNYRALGSLRTGLAPIELLSRWHAGLAVTAFASGATVAVMRAAYRPLLISTMNDHFQRNYDPGTALLDWGDMLSVFLGLFSDCVPIYGTRRKAYVALGWILSALSYGSVYAIHLREIRGVKEPDAMFGRLLEAWSIIGGFALQLSWVAALALIVGFGQREALSERGGLATLFLILWQAGALTAHFTAAEFQSKLTLLNTSAALALTSLVALPFVLCFLYEDEQESAATLISTKRAGVLPALRTGVIQLWEVCQEKVTYRVLLFLLVYGVLLNACDPSVDKALARWSGFGDADPWVLVIMSGSELLH
ncbi:Concanavalin A-like lectin/glucanase domain [Phytophthora cactorum]|nr:Concanavalin A-like lectin/glucanase domain [Phytophthora cactorum]